MCAEVCLEKTIAGCQRFSLFKFRCVDHEFFGDAASNNAGATNSVLFYKRYFGSISRGSLRGGKTTAATSEHQKVEVCLATGIGHWGLLGLTI